MKAKILLKKNKQKISLDRYAGQWVALLDGKIVGAEKTLEKLMKKIKKKKLTKSPSVLLVPREDEGPYIL